MSLEAMKWAYEQDIKPQSVKFTLVTLCNYANEDGISYPSWKTLEKMLSASRKTVYNSLKKLEELGYIKKVSIDYVPKKYYQGQNCYMASVNFTPVQSLHPCKSYTSGGVNLTPKGVQSLHPNIKNKQKIETKEKKYIKKDCVSDVKKSKKVDYISIIDNSVLSVSVKSELKIFFDNRKELAQSDRKFKITTIAVQRIIQNLLSSKFNDDKHRIESISNAIQSNYVTIYPVKNFNQKNSNDNFRDFISEQKQNLQKQNQIINHSLPTLPNNEIDENLILDRFEKQPF